MSDVRYMISDAAKLVDVEAHVLRYWEEELDLPIGRNEMGHRYYTEENIRLFRQIKELKDQGVQLKAVKMLLPDLEKGDSEITHLLARADKLPISADSQTAAREEKMHQFQCIMSRLISEALEDHTEKMGVEIGTQVSDQVIKEMDYLLRMKEERENERFRRLDETIRSSQKARKERALFGGEEKKKRGFSDRKRDRPYRPVPLLYADSADYSALIAPFGHSASQVPQSRHASASITYLPSPSLIASAGHTSAHAPQLTHSSLIT